MAVIDLSEDDRNKGPVESDLPRSSTIDLSLRSKLPDFDQFLTGPLVDEDADHVKLAGERRAAADSALSQLDTKTAELRAREGERELKWSTFDVIALYAELSLDLGLAELDQQKINGQTRRSCSFTGSIRRMASIRCASRRTSSPPTIAAHKATAHRARRQEFGRVWIGYGTSSAAGAGSFDIETGDHLVQLTGADRETRSRSITVTGSVVDRDRRCARERRSRSGARGSCCPAPRPRATMRGVPVR